MSNQPIEETSTYIGQHNRQTSMPRAGFEPATQATKQPQTYTLDRAATGIGKSQLRFIKAGYRLCTPMRPFVKLPIKCTGLHSCRFINCSLLTNMAWS
jgi:hypothetical protein